MRITTIRHPRDAASDAAPGTARDLDHHDYHSAVEIDETQANWKDWVGPGLAIFGVIAAMLLLFLTSGGHI